MEFQFKIIARTERRSCSWSTNYHNSLAIIE